MDQRVLVTGAAGRIGGLLRTRLARPDRVLRLLDHRPPQPAAPAERAELVTASVTDAGAMTEACADVDAVIHLAGIPAEHTWAKIFEVNLDGTRVVLDAAAAAGVARVVLASSVHAAGFRPSAGAGPDGWPADSTARPDTYYGFSKAAAEALGSLYHSRFGLDVICVRIGACAPRPWDPHTRSAWLSPDDTGRLFDACLTAPAPGFRIIWGISANGQRVHSLREARELGYRPQDDAERFAAELPDNHRDDEAGDELLGGPWFTTAPLGEPMS